MTGSNIPTEFKDVPHKYLETIAQLIAGDINDTIDFDEINEPILKPSIKAIYPLFIVQYGILALMGIALNVAIIAYVMYYKMYKDVTQAFIVNLALCHFVQCAIVLPISLMVMLIQNWIFGQFLCFFLPLLQDIPLHVAMTSHLLIAWDRMRWLGDPLKGRLPAFVCCCATWLTGMVIALPYPIYTTYLELSTYVQRLDRVGLCFVNLADDMQEYMRGLFVIMYCGPTTILAYLYIRTSRELRPPDGPFAVMMFEHRADIRNQQRTSSTSSSTGRPNRTNSTRSYDLYNAELDVCKEKRTQRHLGAMAATQVLCVCPLMILRLAKLVMVETYENSGHFDLTYLMFVWIAFLPTVIFPWLYASCVLTRTEKERLRGYFRLSSRRSGMKEMSRSSQEESGDQPVVSEAQEIPIDVQETKTSEKTVNTISDLKKPHHEKARTYARPLNNFHTSRKLPDSVNNSCSNITSSTYCNNGTEVGSVDFENASMVSVDKDSFFEKKWVHTGLRHKDTTFSDCDTFSRNDSSSTLERDLEIIDLLERERSMDIQDMMEREKRGEIVRNYGIERRKLPDLTKICKSPKPDIHKFENQFEYPSQRILSRKSSHSSSGRTKRDSLHSASGEVGLFNDREPSKMTVIENRIKRSTRGSCSSGRSSIKSRDHIPPLPPADLDFRENLFSDL